MVAHHLDRDLDAVEHGDLVGRANQLAFGARTVVAADVDDERVVELMSGDAADRRTQNASNSRNAARIAE